MARRGFLAEIQRQSRLAVQQRQRAQRVAVREHTAAVRRAEQAQRAAERAQEQAARATEAERKRLEKQARDAHVAAMEAQAAEMNAVLAEICDDVDSLLEATLGVDDYVDLETLRTPAEHPPFDCADLETRGRSRRSFLIRPSPGSFPQIRRVDWADCSARKGMRSLKLPPRRSTRPR